jgi:uroporphyrinogen-III synthase
MRVIVTRPEQEGRTWAGWLRERGLDAVLLPLIEIAAVADPQPLREAWLRLDTTQAAMFVSANAVRGFFAAGTGGWPAGTRAWATGPGTRDALLQAGVPPSQVDCPDGEAAQFDSEALWGLVRPQVVPGVQVLLVRGGDASGQARGRDWLAEQVVAAGGESRVVVAYVRRPPAWDERQQAIARAAAGDGSVWLFSSSEAVSHLRALLPGQSWSAAPACATHPRIAQAARALGFSRVDTCRPTLADVVASIESRP